MNTSPRPWPTLLLAVAVLPGCSSQATVTPLPTTAAKTERSVAATHPAPRAMPGDTAPDKPQDPADDSPPLEPPLPDTVPPGVKRAEIGKHVWFETAGEHRRVRVEASVCLRRGNYGLEFLLSRPFKAYESLLATEAEAKTIHAALLVTGAKPGSPVHFEPGKVKPPTGTPIQISLEYTQNGKLVTIPAQRWVRDTQTKKDATLNWVFAGSRETEDFDDPKKKRYAANDDGAYICLINLPTAMMDLTASTPGNPENRAFEPFTERIPAEKTRVIVILEPIRDKK